MRQPERKKVEAYTDGGPKADGSTEHSANTGSEKVGTEIEFGIKSVGDQLGPVVLYWIVLVLGLVASFFLFVLVFEYVPLRMGFDSLRASVVIKRDILPRLSSFWLFLGHSWALVSSYLSAIARFIDFDAFLVASDAFGQACLAVCFSGLEFFRGYHEYVAVYKHYKALVVVGSLTVILSVCWIMRRQLYKLADRVAAVLDKLFPANKKIA